MLESLVRIAERLHQPPSISVEVDKIREQITENKAISVDLEKLQPSYETLKQRGEEMIARSEGPDKDISAKGNVNCIALNCYCTYSTLWMVHPATMHLKNEERMFKYVHNEQ